MHLLSKDQIDDTCVIGELKSVFTQINFRKNKRQQQGYRCTPQCEMNFLT